MRQARLTLFAAMSACLLPSLGQTGEHTVAPAQFFFVPQPVIEPRAPSSATPATATVQTTDRIVGEISAARGFCGRIGQQEYVIDCLADQLYSAAGNIPKGGDYGAARDAIGAAAQELRALARSNADPDLPRARLREAGTGGQSSSRPITPVRSDALAGLNERAATILEQTETVLLRSVENSDRRMVHYQRIADAVGSTKVLLRSL